MANKKKKHPGGRPPKYSTPLKMQNAIDRYFADCPDRTSVFVGGEVGMMEIHAPTITGLALYLGFVNRQSMYDYEANPKFSDTIKNARARMELVYERCLIYGRNTAGAIFALKNFGWTDKQDLEHSGSIKAEHTIGAPILIFEDMEPGKDLDLTDYLNNNKQGNENDEN